MHSRKFLTTALIGAAALALTVTGCGVGGGGGDGSASKTVASDAPIKGTITFQTWSLKNDTFTPYFTALIKSFETAHPGTTIKWIDQPGADYAEKVVSQVTSGNLPDVVNLPPDIAYSVEQAGGLLDLAKNVPTLTADYVASGRKAYTYTGVQGTYGFPWYLGADMNYWNKAMLTRDGLDPTKLPTTLDELITQAKTMHDNSGGKDYLMSREPWLSDIVQTGTSLMNADGTKFVFNTSAAAAMLDKYHTAYEAGYLPPDVLTSAYQGNNAAFLKQEVAWTTGQGNGIQTVQQTNPSLAGQMIPSPSIGTPILNVQGISVASKSKNLPLALSFAQFVTDNENQVAFIKLAPGFMPGTAAAANDPAYSKSDGTPAGDAAVIGYNDLQKAVNYQPPQWTQDMTTVLDQQFALAISGKESSQQALDNIVSKANQILSS
ncbi:MAG: putative chitobiose transport system substrate-binding protein [Streptomyces sp.]|nr:putative chitobiose transport system substrate-binding protein [Streptomyces sp.]